MKDLVVIVPDNNMKFAVREMLKRYDSLGIRKIEFDVFTHLNRDPGCLLESEEFLRPLRREYSNAIVIFDHDGCGEESKSSATLEQQVKKRLSSSGWEKNCAVVVIDPELDIWVWSDSPHVEDILGWRGKTPNLRQWLVKQQYLNDRDLKPTKPKEAFEHALRVVKRPRSSSLYEELASRVGFERCSDASFLRFKTVVRSWFGNSAKQLPLSNT